MTFITKDSGDRTEYPSGMHRVLAGTKPRYDLIDRPILKRLAELMARGAEKYGERNWEKACSQEELEHFEASAFRHFMQSLEGEKDEDHAAAVMFNTAGVEHVKRKLNAAPTIDQDELNKIIDEQIKRVESLSEPTPIFNEDVVKKSVMATGPHNVKEVWNGGQICTCGWTDEQAAKLNVKLITSGTVKDELGIKRKGPHYMYDGPRGRSHLHLRVGRRQL